MKLAVEGDLIARHPESEAQARRLVVVAQFTPNMPDPGVRHVVRDVLAEYHVQTILPEDAAAFAEQVMREAH